MNFRICFSLVSFAGLAVLLMSGCGKKEAAAVAPSNVEVPAAQPNQSPATASVQSPVAADTRLAESQAALQAREYDKAVMTLLALQRARLSEQQAAAAAAQMRQLQGSLANAVASGDPRAKAAAARLRQSATVH